MKKTLAKILKKLDGDETESHEVTEVTTKDTETEEESPEESQEIRGFHRGMRARKAQK